MMAIPPSEAKALTWWEYSAMLHEWNARQPGAEDEQVDAPDAEMVAARQRRLEERGLLTRLH